ncbi:MAG: fatty acid desaturase, partial [Synechococcaceae cyanobacterium ELA182]
WLGYAGAMAYIYTNHFLSPLTEVNDPLLNTLSLKVPRWLDALHLNFSHHVEHHIFPGLNTDYYPMVRRLLIDRYGDRYKQLPAARAWQLLMATPRYYRNSTTLANQAGDHQLQVPLAG